MGWVPPPLLEALLPSLFGRFLRGAVGEVVGIEGGVISGLFKQPGPALARRGRSRHDDG